MDSPTSSSTLSKQACLACKAGKRKCSKELSGCRLCQKYVAQQVRRRGRWCNINCLLRKKWICDYGQLQSRANVAGASASNANQLQRCAQPLELQRVLFLDSRIIQHTRVGFSGHTPGYVVQLIGSDSDIRAFSSCFFDTVQNWMPIISKKRFYNQYISSVSRPEFALLLLCVKLTTEVPTDDPQTMTYIAAKQFYLEVETAGILSIHALQAGVLLALYELAHGIHPSAYLSIGACAMYSYALGINLDAAAPINRPLTRIEKEETRRVWWAVFILDRFDSLIPPAM